MRIEKRNILRSKIQKSRIWKKTVTSSSYHFSLQILHSLPTLRDKYNGLFLIQIEKINKAQKKKRKMGQSFFGNGKKKKVGTTAIITAEEDYYAFRRSQTLSL